MLELPKRYDPLEVEKKWQGRWEEMGTYAFDPARPREDTYSIDTPPPTVSGVLHLGHIYSYVQMDIIARYRRLTGKNVFYPFGFDDNGLPTERMVERVKGVRSLDMPRDEFIKLCLKVTKDAEAEFKEMWQRMGMSVDWSLEYSTINEVSRRAAQRSFIQLYLMGEAYQKEEPTIWDVDNRTALAQAELEDREVESTFSDIIFTFEDGTDVPIATTRPELLPACVAVFCHPDDERYKRFIGGKIKTPHFDLSVPVLSDALVDPEKGTGIVMCCTFGDTVDIDWWRRFDLDTRIVINPDGTLNELARDFAYLAINDARAKIIEVLRAKGLLTKEEKILHTVRCGEKSREPVEYIITNQWFIRVLDKKEMLLARAEEINWWPGFMKVRYRHWVENLGWDWCISRQRHYGVPFPLWYCKSCGAVKLADLSALPVDPLADSPNGACECGATEFEPEIDVMDTWMTSSLTPQLASGWIEEPELFGKLFPFSLRPQAHDIIRTWAFYTIVKGLLHEDKMPWENIFISGHALDPSRKKMSKSKGNVVTPKKHVERFGADALRYWTSTAKLGLDTSFSEKVLSIGKRLLTKIFNASKFCHFHLEDYDGKPPAKCHITDRWLLTKLSRAIEEVTKNYEEYEFSDARAAVEDFFWGDFCDNYLELAKGRLYSDDPADAELRQSARATLFEALLAILKLFSPTIPHVTEEIFSWMYAPRLGEASIHTGGWPGFADYPRDERAEKLSDLMCELLAGVRKLKSDANVSIRRPVTLLTFTAGRSLAGDSELVTALADDEDGVLLDFKNAVNAAEIEYALTLPAGTKVTDSPKGIFRIAAEFGEEEKSG